MVERLSQSLLQMLRSYVEQEADWERYLPLVMFTYRTTVHSSTKVSPFMLMFGRQASFNNFSKKDAFNPNSYEAQLRHTVRWPVTRHGRSKFGGSSQLPEGSI